MERSPTVSNAEIADKLLELAQYLDEHSGNAFKVKAYRRAARTIRTRGESFDELVREEADLTQFPAIGNGIAAAVREIVLTGTSRRIEELRSQASPERLAISAYPRLDAKRVLRIYRKLGISSVDELRDALQNGDVAAKMGSRTAHYVSQALNESREFLLYEADRIAAAVETFLLDRCRAVRAEIAGEVRRRVEVVSELSFVIETSDFGALCRRMEEFGGGTQLINENAGEATFRLPAGIALRLHQADSLRWGAEWIAATGSEKHARQLRRRGCRLEKLDGCREEDVYQRCGLSFIEPELREGTDEIKRAAAGRLPELVTADDIRGELHAHTTASDGKYTIGQMAAAARRRGYEYIGITDHSQSLKIAGGLTEDELWQQIREIDQWNERLDGIRVLKSAEVDILMDGSLDYPDELLRELDYTVCSIHSRFGLGKAEQTERVLRAMDNRYFTILGHATGRLLLKRPGYELDIERVVEHAQQRGCFFEINSSPDRLDLSSEYSRLAADASVKVAITTDAHSIRDFDLVRYGIGVARRAGLAGEQVLNTLPVEGFLALLKRS